jgi:hypothetical protein
MAGYAADRIIVLDEAVDPRKVQLVETGPILSMNLAPGTDAADRDALLARLRSHSKADHFDVFLHDELPSAYQFGDSPRATDVYLVPEAGYVILPERSVEFFTASLPAGGHGYWPTDSVMKASFFAHGPSIAQGKVIPEFPNVNVYGLICRLLGIHPAPNDGDPEWPAQVLR